MCTHLGKPLCKLWSREAREVQKERVIGCGTPLSHSKLLETCLLPRPLMDTRYLFHVLVWSCHLRDCCADVLCQFIINMTSLPLRKLRTVTSRSSGQTKSSARTPRPHYMNARRKALADQRKQLGPTRKSLLDINADFVTSACDSVWQFSSMFFELRFRQSGMNPIRLVKMLKGKGACNCSRKDCFQRLETQADCLAEFIQCFYALSKPDQDEFVPCSKQHACGIHSCSELMMVFVS